MLAHDDPSSYPIIISPGAPSRGHRPAVLPFRAAGLILVTFAVLLIGCGNFDMKARPTAPGPVEPMESTAAITLVIRNYSFVPPNLTVPPGATVTVRNEDQVIHTVTADSWSFIIGNTDSSFNTGNVTHGVPATLTAPTKRGQYPFHCMFFNYMKGTLTVS